MYFSGLHGTENIELPNNNYDSHDFVSVNKNNTVLGYIGYNVNWSSMSCNRFGAMSFSTCSVEFAKDLFYVIVDIFEKYHLNRIEWMCIADNPVIRSYRRFASKYGGIECGYSRQVEKLIDGKLHDAVTFELMAEDWFKYRS